MATNAKGERNVKKAMAIDQRRRQRQMLDRQRSERKDRVMLARMMGGEEEGEDERQAPAASPEGQADSKSKASRAHNRKQVDLDEDTWKGKMMMPDWMIEVPDELQNKWLVAPRPQGCWKGHAVYDCSADFRLFWLQQKISEDAAFAAQFHEHNNPFPLHILPWYFCDMNGIESAYRTLSCPFVRDGLQFLHRESHYEIGLTPLMLLWKDMQCGQVVCLRVMEDGALTTSDDPAVVITRAPDEQKQIIQTNSDKLALFKIAGISITYPDNCNEMSVSGPPDVTVEAIEFFSPAAAKRADADSLSKALFQQALRTQPLSIEDIVNTAMAQVACCAP
ncbi:hypothetical protein GUITHDRAFT_108080 [Guillardia theta CCMP2712]|uniref:Snurportin-1 n=1 Tax=Guillardia theta (strain CCMP2712) TaxID=905079 RepID=L1JD62_GUITC|nr:hypothetical protein GUITHDRAFT_108080 [Guillardia theta CCMP2712]EKX46045.1 hypothetical protein GUITHDRAFT_108080 [Guillardia theta CCMP2712]|eukprot:XP_005833025.1 hypothetical protein GUITHDRAFT_108080 [Guillardia theta CCMP2712]